MSPDAKPRSPQLPRPEAAPSGIIDMSNADVSRAVAPESIVTDICIIGSGCAGATAAHLLSAAGHDVVVLEEGKDYTGNDLTQRDAAMYDQLYMDRGGRSTDDLAISVLQGRVLGGGGVINACDVVPTPPSVWNLWSRVHGLSEMSPTAMEPYAAAALDDLSTNDIEESQLNRANRLLRAGNESLGWRGEVMRHNRVGCAELGTCLIGCPADAKRNPRFVAIPRALAAGARFFTRARAVAIRDATSEIKRVLVHSLDARGYHETHAWQVRARKVIIAANAIDSAALLLRSGLGNDHVGRRLMLQPQLPVISLFKEPVNAFRGIPQAYAVTEFEDLDHPAHGWWGFRIEAVMGTPGIVATLVPAVGREAKALMSQYAHSAGALLLAPDEPSGRVTLLPSGRARITYDHRDNHKERLRQAAKAAARVYLAAGAKSVGIPIGKPVTVVRESELARLDALDFAPATAPIISAHQQGTVRMSSSAARGAADPAGQVYGTRQVYVFDSSLFPSSASSHTMAPIITVARFLSARLLAESA